MATNIEGLNFSSTAHYLICVKGFLDDSWSERFSGMSIVNTIIDDKTPVTELYGRLSDQSELFGILSSIYEMHLPIINVKLTNDDHVEP